MSTEFKVGDKVFADFRGVTRNGTVTKIDKSGYQYWKVRVEWDDGKEDWFSYDGWYASEHKTRLQHLEPSGGVGEEKPKFEVGDNVTIHWSDTQEKGVIVKIDANSRDEYEVIEVFAAKCVSYYFSLDGFFTSEKKSSITKDEVIPITKNEPTNDLIEFANWIKTNCDSNNSTALHFAAGVLGNTSSPSIAKLYKKFKNESDPQYQEYLRLKAIYG